MHLTPVGDRARLTVIFLQYDRQKYRFAFERLVSLLTRLESVDLSIVVVDNANPGFWQHSISDRIVQIGGDNSAWEFSGFDRGIDYVEHEASDAEAPDIYAFVTDAFQVYGEDYLELIDDDTLRYCLELRAAVGWVDSFGESLSAFGLRYREWMRTSFFFVPAEILPQIRPLAWPMDPDKIFGPTAKTPFRETELSAPLRHRLLAWLTQEQTEVELEEVWHSQLELNEKSFAFFKAKTMAILREHLLSARLQAAGTPCYEFRLIRKLTDWKIEPSRLSEIERRDWQWLAGRDAKIEKSPRYFLEHYTAPRTTEHGRSSELRLVGWVIADPPVRQVVVRLTGGHTVTGSCDVPRPDAIANFPEFTDELCGFELNATLDFLPPGTYELEWAAVGVELSEMLGTIDVLPALEFEEQTCFLTESAFPGRMFPVQVRGLLECSTPLRRIRPLWDGQEAALEKEFRELRRKSNGLYRYDVEIHGELNIVTAKPQHRLDLEFQAEDGTVYTWQRAQPIRIEETRPHTLLMQQIGKFDAESRSVPVLIRGAVHTLSSDERLVLRCEGQPVYERELAAVATVRQSTAWFEIQREIVGIPAGTWELSLALKSKEGATEVFARWQERVQLKAPIIHVEPLQARLPNGKESPFFLTVRGWVEHQDLVERLLFKVDGELVAMLGIQSFRADVAEGLGKTLIQRQGFDAEVLLDVPPGEHFVELVAEQEGGASEVWSDSLRLGKTVPADFRLRSADLNALESDDPCWWSSIVIAGEAITELADVTVTLYVNDRIVDHQDVEGSGAFLVRHVPEQSGSYALRVVFRSEGMSLYDSGTVPIAFVDVELPQVVPEILELFVKRFGLFKVLDLGDVQALSRVLVQRELECLPEFIDMIREIGARLASEAVREETEPELDTEDGKRLKVLLATWEVPNTRHGGGAWIFNFIKALRDRHDLTVIHGYGPGEEGWEEEVRPYVSKIISIPRMHQPALYRGDAKIPAAYFNDYTPALRAAIEAEVFAGDYDLVDYEYTQMLPHMSRADLPRVMGVLEEGFLAALSQLAKTGASRSESIDRLRDLLKSFYFTVSALPRASGDIIAITEEDAEVPTSFQSDARIYVNTIGVDTELESSEEMPQGFPSSRPTVIFLGNYRHAPNTDAVLFFADRVLPELKEKIPALEFFAVGSHPTPELQELGARDGITITGFVEDYRPYLRAGTVFVAPIFTGAGMRVKILEAMACAIPVVGTQLSMHGIGAIDGKHYLQAEGTRDFVEMVERCVEEPEAARAIGKRGRELIVERHSHEQSARRREAIWRSAIERHRLDPSTPGQRLTLVRGVHEQP